MYAQALENWRNATTNLPWGVQGAVYDALTLASEGKITLVYGADYKDGRPCLFNAIRQMTTQLSDTPTTFAPEVVMAFDTVNSLLYGMDVNTSVYKVSPLAADVLIQNFGKRKEQPTADDLERQALARESFMRNCTPYIEPTDEEIITDWLFNSTEQVTNEDSRHTPSV